MKTNEKSQTIKIDIRSLGYGRVPGMDAQRVASAPGYFDKLDYRFLFEHAYDAILLADGNGNVLEANARAARFFGYEDSGLSGFPLNALVAGVSAPLLAEIRAVIADGRYMRIQAFAVHKGDVFSAVEIVAMGNGVRASDEPVCYLIRDIQSRWQAEQKLLSAYHAMDNTDEGIGIADMRGVITYANRMLTELLANGDEAAVVGQNLECWFDRGGVLDPMQASICRGEAWTGEQRVLVGEQTGWLMISAVPDINEENELCGMVLAIRDTAERRRAEVAEQQTERNRLMMESLAEACHALGQPATVLLTSIEILRLEADKDEQTRREMVDLCYGAVIQMRGLLQQMNNRRMVAAESFEAVGTRVRAGPSDALPVLSEEQEG